MSELFLQKQKLEFTAKSLLQIPLHANRYRLMRLFEGQRWACCTGTIPWRTVDCTTMFAPIVYGKLLV